MLLNKSDRQHNSTRLRAELPHAATLLLASQAGNAGHSNTDAGEFTSPFHSSSSAFAMLMPLQHRLLPLSPASLCQQANSGNAEPR
jgi:hypothetical protein